MKRSRTIGLLLAAAVLAAILSAVYLHFRPQAVAGEKGITIEVAYADGAVETYEVQTDAEYLKEAAESVLTLEGETGAYGFTLYAVNGAEANFETGSAYWAVYVNGEYGQYSLDAQPVADGDVFRLAYETY